FFSSRRRHTRSYGDWSSDVCSSDLFDALNVVEPGKEAIFFLSRMSESDARLKDAGVLPPQAKTMELLPFDVSGLYKFTDEKSWRSEERRVRKENISGRWRERWKKED